MLEMATSQADVLPDCVGYMAWLSIRPSRRRCAFPSSSSSRSVPFLIAVVPRRALPHAEPTVATRVPVRIFPPPSRLATDVARSRSGRTGGAAVGGN